MSVVVLSDHRICDFVSPGCVTVQLGAWAAATESCCCAAGMILWLQ